MTLLNVLVQHNEVLKFMHPRVWNITHTTSTHKCVTVAPFFNSAEELGSIASLVNQTLFRSTGCIASPARVVHETRSIAMKETSYSDLGLDLLMHVGADPFH